MHFILKSVCVYVDGYVCVCVCVCQQSSMFGSIYFLFIRTIVDVCVEILPV